MSEETSITSLWAASGPFLVGGGIRDGKWISLDPSECPPDVRARLIENGSLRLDDSKISVSGRLRVRGSVLNRRQKLALYFVNFCDWVSRPLRKFVQHPLER